MAKYTRYDPRNKKKDRNKQRSLHKDIRIHEETKNQNRRDWYRFVDTLTSDDEVAMEKS